MVCQVAVVEIHTAQDAIELVIHAPMPGDIHVDAAEFAVYVHCRAIWAEFRVIEEDVYPAEGAG